MRLQTAVSNYRQYIAVAVEYVLFIVGFAVFAPIAVTAQNKIDAIPDGGHIERWLVSNPFPAEIDAGMWENFNRFNIETLPQKNWLRPFGRIVPGVQRSAVRSDGAASAKEQQRASDSPLPEVGAESTTRIFPDASEISWTPVTENDGEIDFFSLHKDKPIGTGYAAAYLNVTSQTTRYIETNGFLGTIWLNGIRIYDGYSLTADRVVPAQLIAGENLLIVRASGISGDYWRKDGGWKAVIRVWRDIAAAEEAARYKSANVPGTIYYLEGFHVDPVYLQDQRGYSKVTLSNTSQYLRSLRADKNYGVFLSEIDYLKPYLDTHPEDREFLRGAVAEGRVGTGGAYNQFNEMNIGGEAMIRNILYGQEMHKAMLGRKSESLAMWDVFGHAPQLSQVAAKSGFTGVAWSKKITGFQPFFHDYALDGTRLLHRRVDYAYSFSGFGSGKNYSFDDFLRMTERKFAEPLSFGIRTDLRINAADFTPPWTNLAGNVAKLESNRPQIRVTGQAQDLYFRDMNRQAADGMKLPFSSRDKLFFHVGVMMARSDLKIGQRFAENMTLNAEKFSSIAYLLGARYPDLALDKAWRQIFFGSHHDAVTGTPSDSAFLDLVLGYREAYELAERALTDSLRFIAHRVNTTPSIRTVPKEAKPVVVFNPMNWRRTDAVRIRAESGEDAVLDDRGRQVPAARVSDTEFEFVASDVPSMGYRTFYIYSSPEASQADTAGTLENEFYRIMVDPARGGAVTSIFDKLARREVISTTSGRFGNEIAVLEEELTRKNVIYPAWEMWTTGKRSFSGERHANVRYEDNGAARSYIIEGTLPNGTRYRQTISLRDGVRRIDMRTELLDYRGYNELFVVNFPLALEGGALVTEDRFGTVVRNGSKGYLDFRTNTDKLVSGAPVYGVYNWASYGSTFDLRFVEGGKNVASVPFKPAAVVMSGNETHVQAAELLVSGMILRGVSMTPFYDDHEASRRGGLSIEDSTMPKRLNDDIAYHSFRVVIGGETENKYAAELLKQVSAETAAKFKARVARDGHAFLFLYDKNVPEGWGPMPVLILAGDVRAASEELVRPIRKGASTAQPSFFKDDRERREYQSLDTFAVSIPFESFAVETNPAPALPQVPNYGVALVNGGTPGMSLEGGNTLTLHLTHTALWPGINLPFEFVPEGKSHTFTYSLVPHSGSWRDANVVRSGYDVNNPLIALRAEKQAGPLPASHSFIDSRVSNLVISALKLGGNPQATFNSREMNEMSRYPTNELRERGGLRSLILRAYESNGHATGPGLETNIEVLHGSEIGMAEQEEYSRTGISFGGRLLGINGFQANEIRTYELFAKREPVSEEELGTTAEPVQPVYSRYWMHNMGAAPIGNDAVKVTLRPVEQMGALSTFSWSDPYNQGGITTNPVRLQLVNNYQDRRISGEVMLEVPKDWRVVPDRIAYDIVPNGSMVRDIVVLAFPVKRDLEFERASGLVKARIVHEGQTFQDVLQIGNPYRLEWRTEHTSDGVTVWIKNPHRQSIEGSVALITPPETWLGGFFSPEPRFPREQGFTVPARSEIQLRFSHGEFAAGSWRIARLTYNGNTEYKRADGKVR